VRLDHLVLRYPHCVVCGRTFPAYTVRALVCSPSCSQRRWRAITMLQGTHGYVDGRFKRFSREVSA
jgi:hypothetical protein